MKELLLLIVSIVSIFLISISLTRLNRNKEIKGSVKSALIYLTLLIPVLGFVLSSKYKKDN
jgi:hypothetical protein